LAAGAAAIAFTGGGGGQADDAKAIEAYEAALLPLVKEWGQIEVQGMRPAIADLSTGEGVPPETVAGEARAWRAGFEALRPKIAALDPPKSVQPAEALFDQSMQHYLDATVAFEQAADGPAEARRAGIDKGIAAAKEGARLYNEASLVLQRARRAAGLPTSPDFPNRPAGDEVVS
jgi:hypothetical protein